MPIKKTKKKLSAKKVQRGTVGNFFVFGVLALLMVLGITAVGGAPPQNFPLTGQIVNAVTPGDTTNHTNLQLKTFGYVTIAPTITPGAGSLCRQGGINSEPYILVGYSPGAGQTVSNTGQVKVWVNDEGAPFIAPGEQVDPKTGQITKPGDRTATADDGFLLEPALYIAPATAESGGTPHFPDIIKGQFNNSGQGNGFNLIGNVTNGPTADTPPAGSGPVGASNPNGFAPNQYVAEYIWNVSGLGLSAGTYQAEFLIHDGDRDRGIGCVTLQIK